MLKRQALFAILATGALSLTAYAAPADSTSPLVGVWTADQVRTAGAVNDRPQPSLYIFTRKHYSIVRVVAEKPREIVDPGKATAATLRATYVDGFIANAGTYRTSGSTLTIWPTVAKSPEVMRSGASLEYRYEIRDGALFLTQTRNTEGPVAQDVTHRFKRVE